MKKSKRARKQASCFDDGCVPARIAADEDVRAARLDLRAQWMLSFIDGQLCLGDVLARAGLPFDEAREGVSDLVVHGIVALNATTESKGAWT
jgi:hypothetical protein